MRFILSFRQPDGLHCLLALFTESADMVRTSKVIWNSETGVQMAICGQKDL